MAKAVKPAAHLLAYTQLYQPGVQSMLKAIGAEDWHTNPEVSDSENLIEICGRLCYKSFKIGLNPNVTRVREGNKEYIDNILRQKHGSVLEHASVTFGFTNVTRVFTHEIVRHRLCAFSQESLRYVRLTDIDYRLPPAFENTELAELFESTVKLLEDIQIKMGEACGLDDPTMPFRVKKELTSAFRRLAPIGLATNIIVTTNHRNWRHLLALRTSEGAEEEIREVFGSVAYQLADLFPHIYQDMFTVGGGVVEFRHGRV